MKFSKAVMRSEDDVFIRLIDFNGNKDTMIKKEGRTKSKDAMVAEPEMVYGRGRAMQGCLMQYIVPKKDQSFFEDLAKVRGWKSFEPQQDIEQPKARRRAMDIKKENPLGVCYSMLSVPTKKKLSGLEKAIQEVDRGEVWEYASSDDMFDQILGKGWRTK